MIFVVRCIVASLYIYSILILATGESLGWIVPLLIGVFIGAHILLDELPE